MSSKRKEFWEEALFLGLCHPFGVWAPAACLVAAIVSRFLIWDLPGVGLVFMMLLVYLAVWFAGGIIAALFGVAANRRNDAVKERELQAAFANASHWKLEFEQTLGFYESMGGKKLRVMQELSEQMNAVFDSHAKWRDGREQADAGRMALEFESLALRLEGACADMNDAMKSKMTKARRVRHSA